MTEAIDLMFYVGLIFLVVLAVCGTTVLCDLIANWSDR